MYSQRSISFMTDDRRRICAEIRRWEPKFAVPQNHRHLGGAMDTLETKNKRPSRNGLIKCAIRACSQLGCALMPEDYRSVGDCASVCGCVCVCVCACVCVCVCCHGDRGKRRFQGARLFLPPRSREMGLEAFCCALIG